MSKASSERVRESFDVRVRCPEQTAQVASVLAARLKPGDAVLLTGELASGKTTFTKAVTAALGSTDLVTSPTFTLAQIYSSPGAPILHVDAYRLADVAEYIDLGLDEQVEESITLVEWGEKIASEFPCHLLIEFTAGTEAPDDRTLSFSSTCERWRGTLAELRDGMPEVAA